MIDFDSLVLSAVITIFGEPVTYLSAQGGSASITAVFDERFAEELWKGDVATLSYRPRLGCQASALPVTPGEGDRFIVRNQLFLVRTVHADGVGHLAISLDGPVT